MGSDPRKCENHDRGNSTIITEPAASGIETINDHGITTEPSKWNTI